VGFDAQFLKAFENCRRLGPLTQQAPNRSHSGLLS
jgi:hypothetical protein